MRQFCSNPECVHSKTMVQDNIYRIEVIDALGRRALDGHRYADAKGNKWQNKHRVRNISETGIVQHLSQRYTDDEAETSAGFCCWAVFRMKQTKYIVEFKPSVIGECPFIDMMAFNREQAILAQKDVLKMVKEKVDDALAPVRANRAKKQAELEKAKLDEEIATQTAKIHEICCEKEIDFAALIEKQDCLALTERKKKQYQKILDEMFPED